MTVSNFILREQQVIDNVKDKWSMEKIQSYFNYVRSTFFPELTDDAKVVLQEYYKKQRTADMRNAARTTIRLLESLIRLAQAHARIMHRNLVLLQDAIVAILLMESSMASSALLGFENAVRSVFPEDPEAVYREQEEALLHALKLDELIPVYGPSDDENDTSNVDENNQTNSSYVRSQYSQMLHDRLKEAREREKEEKQKLIDEEKRVAEVKEDQQRRLVEERLKTEALLEKRKKKLEEQRLERERLKEKEKERNEQEKGNAKKLKEMQKKKEDKTDTNKDNLDKDENDLKQNAKSPIKSAIKQKPKLLQKKMNYLYKTMMMHNQHRSLSKHPKINKKVQKNNRKKT